MLISKSPAAFGVGFRRAPCAFAQTETRLPKVGASAARAEAQGYSRHRIKNGCAPARAAAGPRDLLRVRLISVRHVPHCPHARGAFCQFLKE